MFGTRGTLSPKGSFLIQLKNQLIGGAFGTFELVVGAVDLVVAAATFGAGPDGGAYLGGAVPGGGLPAGGLIVGALPRGADSKVDWLWSFSPFSISLVTMVVRIVPRAIAGLLKFLISLV